MTDLPADRALQCCADKASLGLRQLPPSPGLPSEFLNCRCLIGCATGNITPVHAHESHITAARRAGCNVVRSHFPADRRDGGAFVTEETTRVSSLIKSLPVSGFSLVSIYYHFKVNRIHSYSKEKDEWFLTLKGLLRSVLIISNIRYINLFLQPLFVCH